MSPAPMFSIQTLPSCHDEFTDAITRIGAAVGVEAVGSALVHGMSENADVIGLPGEHLCGAGVSRHSLRKQLAREIFQD